MFAICNLSIVPLRAEPSDKSEIVSQVLFGEHFQIVETLEKWVKIHLHYDDYEGWIDSKQYQEIAKISIVPSLFGITEPVIFGMPLVLNFDLAIPFIFNNTIALIVAYALTKIGIVANFIGVQAIFGLPVGFHAAVQGSLSIILLQLGIQFILSPLLWYPWFKRLDKKAYALEQATLND